MHSDRRYPLMLHCVGQRSLRLPFPGGGGAKPHVSQSASVLTARVPGWPNPLWGTPPLSRWAYPMPEWSWRLCVCFRWSCYARQWWDGLQYSSAYWQARMGAIGYILSCLVLNGATSQGSWPRGHFSNTRNLQAWLPGGLGAYRVVSQGWAIVGWQLWNPARPRPSGWRKRLVWIESGSSSF
jgi:hypothetical protein